MQILVFSDSHGHTESMEAKIRALTPDLILHLGDCDKDARRLSQTFPHIPLRMVRGNCDLGSKTSVLENFVIAETRIVMTHGHRYNVKSGYKTLYNMGHCAGADILLFGHTHIPHYEQVGAMHVLNPGSANESCGLIRITDGEIICELLSL